MPLRGPLPDLVLVDGKVFTADPARRYVQALAIAGDRILAAGTTEEIMAMAGVRTRRVELGRRTVIPGINDAHFHHTPDPRGTVLPFTSPEPRLEEVLDALAVAVKFAPKGSWIFGTHGVDVVNDPRATRFALDKVAPEHPVRLNAYFGHGSVLNSRALAALQLSEEQPDPYGGCCERVPGSSRITGKFFGYAQWPHWRNLARQASADEAAFSARDLADRAVRFGVTSMQIMSHLDIDAYALALQRAGSPIRARLIRFPGTGAFERQLAGGSAPPSLPTGSDRIRVSGTKWLLDGTPLERHAALRSDYRDKPGWSGRLYMPKREMTAMLRESLESGDQLLVHAVGDRTTELFLEAMEAEAAHADWRAQRVRIEHGDGLARDLMPRARDLGTIVVQNPTHFSFDAIFAERFGKQADHQPLRSLLDAGIPLALGSDGPLNPFLNIMLAATHPARPDEAITLEQAVHAYTRGSAFAEFQEDEKGVLAPGMLADLAVLSQDIFSVPLGELPRTHSVLTIIAGETAYDSGALTDVPLAAAGRL